MGEIIAFDDIVCKYASSDRSKQVAVSDLLNNESGYLLFTLRGSGEKDITVCLDREPMNSLIKNVLYMYTQRYGHEDLIDCICDLLGESSHPAMIELFQESLTGVLEYKLNKDNDTADVDNDDDEEEDI